MGGILVKLDGMYYVYVVQSLKDMTTYIGYTSDIEKRIKEHNLGKTRSIRHKLPVKLVYSEVYEDKTEARKRELELKRNSSIKEKLFKKIFENNKARSSRG